MLVKILNRLMRKIVEFYFFCEYANYRKQYNIEPSFIFNGNEILFYGEGDIICKKNSYIGRYSSIQCGINHVVHIGERTSISHNVRIYTNSAVADQDFSLKGTNDFNEVSGNVYIGDNVWIGANVFITENTSIGDNCVIGANTVVNKNLPPHSICAGVPAKVIKFKSYLTDIEISNYIHKYPSVITDKVLKKYV